MTNFVTYNPRGNNPKYSTLVRFGGVDNRRLGANIAPQLVDDALDSDSRWRGAVKKRDGYQKYLTKNISIDNFGQAFDGFFYQGDNAVHYRVDALADYLIRPGQEDFQWFNWSSIGFTPYDFTLGLAESSFVVPSGGSYSASGTTLPGGLETPSTHTGNEWRFRHIIISVNERYDMLGLGAPPWITVDPSLDDSLVDSGMINEVRAVVEGLNGSFVKNTIQDTMTYTDYHDLLETANVGARTNPADPATYEWANVTAAGAIEYRNNVNAGDQFDTAFWALELILGQHLVDTAPTRAIEGSGDGTALQSYINVGGSPTAPTAAAAYAGTTQTPLVGAVAVISYTITQIGAPAGEWRVVGNMPHDGARDLSIRFPSSVSVDYLSQKRAWVKVPIAANILNWTEGADLVPDTWVDVTGDAAAITQNNPVDNIIIMKAKPWDEGYPLPTFNAPDYGGSWISKDGITLYHANFQWVFPEDSKLGDLSL